MALTAGTLSQVSVLSNSVVVASTVATGGTGPYTYQWYISTSTGFVPGAGSLVAGATSLQPTITGLIPNTAYFAKLVSTDTGAGNATVTSTQLAVTTTPQQLSQNQFAQVPIAGQLDLRFDYDTVSVLIDVSQATPLYAGMAVKVVNSSGGVPKVIGCAADSDSVFGFIQFDIKTIAFSAGAPAEIGQGGNCMYLYATGAIARGTQVTLDLSASAAVAQATGSSGSTIVGWAYDQAAGAGSILRVRLTVPSFTLD